MSYIVIAKFVAKPESTAALAELITQTATQSWLEPGLIKYILVKDPTQPELFTIVEFFVTESDYLSHRETDHLAKFRTAVTPLLASPPEVVRGVAALANLDPKASIN